MAPILSIRIVDELETAIEHINRYGSEHTDVIVTENYTRVLDSLFRRWIQPRLWLMRLRSLLMALNALGAEVGISTDKLHARGPVGLEGLTSQKCVSFTVTVKYVIDNRKGPSLCS